MDVSSKWGCKDRLSIQKPLRKIDVQSIMKQYFSFDGPLLDYKGGAIPISGQLEHLSKRMSSYWVMLQDYVDHSLAMHTNSCKIWDCSC